ncbi:hypothetical protein LOTGIDRAFT_235860 [Lottia gigantea]|uniref:Protein kinase domain-containing protein n=1 Tax=Lottia gigantea TaxID=225164 RepID=V4B8S5_LOTGI|nr:hypothetical protein LOTGIDRAFT_235860 [Lottia gigantea]ESO85199.1 hypothetical protein LOTGIDRAFT_235860 [Lottia gigantea]
MSVFVIISIVLFGVKGPVTLSIATERPFSDSVSGNGDVNGFDACKVRVKTGGIINLRPLTRNDGYARFFASKQLWNYTFDPCTAYNEPKDPHTGFGDGCSSVLLYGKRLEHFCGYSREQFIYVHLETCPSIKRIAVCLRMCIFGFDGISHHYYTLGIERSVRIQMVEDDANNKTAIQLVLKGTKSMRNRLTFINLICDRSRIKTDEALFEISSPMGKGPVEANLHHVCCCPDGCLEPISSNHTTNSTELEELKKVRDKRLLLIVVLTNLGLLVLAAVIGALCYIKRTQIEIYYKLPGLGLADPNARRPGDKSGIKSVGRGSMNRPSPYSDWEPKESLKKKLLPVLDDSVIALNSLDMRQRLGGGLFGDTHIAKWNGIDVAVKRLILNVHQNQVTAKTMEYMNEEVWKLSRLRHKLIVTVIGLCLDGKLPYIITEHVDGECLRDFIKVKGHQLTWPQRIKICTQIADGLAFLHSSKPLILHRDLRCGNIFIIDEDAIKVGDFGLTKLIQPMREQCTQDDCCCMREYSACPAMLRWTAPEILSQPTVHEGDNNSVFTPSCDVYSLGMVFWEIIVCEDPFEDLSSEEEIIEFVVGGGRPELPDTSDLITQYKDLIVECWCQKPQLRPSAKQVAVKLKEMMQPARAFQKSLKSKSHPPKSQQSSSHIV